MAIPEINYRLKQLIDLYTDGSVNKFAKSIGVAQQKLNRLFNPDPRTNKYPVATTDILQAVTYNYETVNCTWLLKGEGKMFVPSDEEIQDMAKNYTRDILDIQQKMTKLGYFDDVPDHQNSQHSGCDDDSRFWSIIESQQRQLESQQRVIETLTNRVSDSNIVNYPPPTRRPVIPAPQPKASPAKK